MPNTALFINEKFIKDFSPIASNVDVSFVWPFVHTAQDTHIQIMVGKALYQGLQDRIVNETLTSHDTELLSLLRQALLWKVVDQYIPWSWVQLRNKGVGQNSGENFQPVGVNDIRYLREEAKNQFEFYAQRVNDYLCDNASEFAEYDSTSKPTARDAKYDSDLYLGPSNDCGCGGSDCSCYRRFIS